MRLLKTLWPSVKNNHSFVFTPIPQFDGPLRPPTAKKLPC